MYYKKFLCLVMVVSSVDLLTIKRAQRDTFLIGKIPCTDHMASESAGTCICQAHVPSLLSFNTQKNIFTCYKNDFRTKVLTKSLANKKGEIKINVYRKGCAIYSILIWNTKPSGVTWFNATTYNNNHFHLSGKHIKIILDFDKWAGQLIKIEFNNGSCGGHIIFIKVEGEITYPLDFSKLFPGAPTQPPVTIATIPTIITSKPTTTTAKPTTTTAKPTTTTAKPTTTTAKPTTIKGDSGNQDLIITLASVFVVLPLVPFVVSFVCRKRLNGKKACKQKNGLTLDDESRPRSPMDAIVEGVTPSANDNIYLSPVDAVPSNSRPNSYDVHHKRDLKQEGYTALNSTENIYAELTLPCDDTIMSQTGSMCALISETPATYTALDVPNNNVYTGLNVVQENYEPFDFTNVQNDIDVGLDHKDDPVYREIYTDCPHTTADNTNLDNPNYAMDDYTPIVKGPGNESYATLTPSQNDLIYHELESP